MKEDRKKRPAVINNAIDWIVGALGLDRPAGTTAEMAVVRAMKDGEFDMLVTNPMRYELHRQARLEHRAKGRMAIANRIRTMDFRTVVDRPGKNQLVEPKRVLEAVAKAFEGGMMDDLMLTPTDARRDPPSH